MNTPRMSHTLMALFAVAGIGYAGIATATGAPISADKFSAEKSRIDMTYKSELESCKPMSGNSKDLCEVSAKGHRDVALAENDAAYKPSVKARYDARLARADADFKLAKEKCDDFAGNAKDVCVKQAQAAEVKAKADAKVDRVAADSNQTASKQVAEAKQDAREDKLSADYKVAIEKCDALAADAKARCVADAKGLYGRS
jgi:hypothetical protein